MHLIPEQAGRYLIVLCCGLLMGYVVGCSSEETRVFRGGQTPQASKISQEELRQELGKFEDFFVSSLKQTVEELNTAGPTQRFKRTNIQMQSRVITALHAMTEQDDAVVAFLDTWGLVERLRSYIEEGAGRTYYGSQQQLMQKYIRDAEMEIERIGSLFMTPEQLATSKRGVVSFALQNPVGGTYSNLVIYATQTKQEETGVLLKTLSIPMAPFRAMEGVDKTADAIGKFRISAERFTDVVEQLPESTRWQMSVLMDDFEESEMTQKFLTSLNDFTKSSTQLVGVIDAMPRQMRTEMTTLLEQSEKTQDTLQTTLKTATETANRLEQVLVEFQKTSQSVNGTVGQANEAAAAIKNASDSIQKLVGMFESNKPIDVNAPPSFGMRDFDTMLLNAGQTADKIGIAVARIQQVSSSDAKVDIQTQIRMLVDHIVWRLIQLALMIFSLYLVTRFFCNRFFQKAG